MTAVYLALGANLGATQAHIAQAIQLLGSQVQDVKQAPLYISKAVGYTDQPDFLNTALAGQTDLSPQALLAFTQAVEHQVGRVARFHWGPREIDIDIILYGDQVIETAGLTIPHSAFRVRDFVLRPLNDLNPQLRDPVSGQTISELLARLPPDQISIRQPVDEKG